MDQPSASLLRSRLARADEHIAALAVTFESFRDRPFFGIEHRVWEVGLVHAIHLVVHDHAPFVRFSVIFSDCLHNLRSTLDHLIYALAAASTGQNPPPFADALEFPIIDNPANFPNPGRRDPIAPLRQNPQFVDAIEAVQPYNQPSSENIPALTLLKRLSNVDKHRQLPIVMNRMISRNDIELKFSTPTLFTQTAEIFADPGPIRDGHPIFGVRLGLPDPDLRIISRVDISPAILHDPFPDGRIVSDIDWVATYLRDEVARILERFSPLLP